jgi:phosphoribosyl 1,2-cyclic phosphodiesterase
MKIKIWGCRGSLTTPGPHTVRYGGNTACLEIRDAQDRIIVVDAGSGMRNLGKALLNEPDHTEILLLFTHTHWDHIVGFPFFAPAYLESYHIRICGGPAIQKFLPEFLTQQMAAPFFPVEFKHLQAKFSFGNACQTAGGAGLMHITPIAINHPNGGYGFKFEENGKTFVFLTDNELDFPHPNGLGRQDYVEFCRGADLLIHDAQYTAEEYFQTRGWGHSSYADATDLAIEAGVKQFALFHHDPDRSDDDLDYQLDGCRKRIAQAGAKTQCIAAAEGLEFQL